MDAKPFAEKPLQKVNQGQGIRSTLTHKEKQNDEVLNPTCGVTHCVSSLKKKRTQNILSSYDEIKDEQRRAGGEEIQKRGAEKRNQAME